MISQSYTKTLAGGLLIALSMLAGCSGPKGTRLQLQTFDESGKANRHYTDFTRASYSRTSDGHIELVLQAEQPSQLDPSQTITQIVHLKTFWAPRYGVTYADSTQINARMQYAILTPPTGVRYDGGAFVTYDIDKLTNEVVGYIESGDLSPKLHMGSAAAPFGAARCTGTFRAKENPGEVVNTAQSLASEFGG